MSTILNGFRSALAPGPWKILIVVAIVGGLILLAVAGYLLKGARDRRRRLTLADRLYEQRVAEAGLTTEDRRLLDSLVAKLDRPPEQKHRLLANPALFHQAATRAVADGVATSASVTALQMALGLAHASARGLLRSSTEIEAGATVLLTPEGAEPLGARVIEVTPGALVVQAEGTERLPGVGMRLKVALTTVAGSFHFPSEVLARSEGVLSLAHSDSVEHEQARRFYRKGVQTPVAVHDPMTGADCRTQLLELSGGGASLEMPPGSASVGPGQALDLRLELPGGKPLTVSARVVRVSTGGTRLHLEFQGLSARSQDRIIQYVLG